MSRQIDPDVHVRNEKIVTAFQSNQMENIPRLAMAYGLSVSSVRKILKTAGVDTAGRVNQGPQPMALGEALTRRHRRIGQVISDIRTFQMKRSQREFAKLANVSIAKLSRGEFGCYDWTITELTRVAEALGLDFADLINPKEASAYDDGTANTKVLDLHLPVSDGGVTPRDVAALRNVRGQP